MQKQSNICKITGLALALLLGLTAAPAHAQGTIAEEQGPQGLEKVLQGIEDLPAELQKKVKEAYENFETDAIIPDYYDTACLALKYRDYRLENPEGGEATPILFTDFGEEYARVPDCVDREKTAEYMRKSAEKYYERYLRILGSNSKMTTEQRKQLVECISKRGTAAFRENPVPDGSYAIDIFIKALNQCEDKILN